MSAVIGIFLGGVFALAGALIYVVRLFGREWHK